MAYEPDALLTKLGQDYEFDDKSAFALGWCNVLKAQSRNMGHPVWIYYPLKEVWEESGARKSLSAQFRGYDKLEVHECLPQAIEIIEGKAAAGGIALITSRFPEENLMSEERDGQGTSWLNNDSFSMPLKIGALRSAIEASNILHGFGIIHASIGHETLSVSRVNNRPLVRFDLLGFGDPTAETPKSVPWFHAAFNAPETIGGNNHSKGADVYALAKFLIYFLVGPQRFMQLFGALPAEATWEGGSDGEDAQKLFDHTLWGNLAQDGAEPDAEGIKRASDNELSLELAELLRRAVVRDVALRPKDAQVLYQGFESSMGQSEAQQMQQYAAMPRVQMGESSDNKMMKLVMVGAIVMAVLGGAWFFLQQQAKERLRVNMNTACKDFTARFDELETSLIRDLPNWSRIEEARGTISQLKGDEAQFENILALCTQGKAKIAELKGQLIVVLKDQLARDIDFAREGGTNLKPLNLEPRANTVKTLEEARDFKGLEAELRFQSDDVRKAHDVVLRAGLESTLDELGKARLILNIETPGEEEARILTDIEAALPESPTADALQIKHTLVEEGGQFMRRNLSEVARARLVDLADLANGLRTDGVVQLGRGFDTLETRQQNLAVATVPESSAMAVDYFREIAAVGAGLNELRSHMDGLADENDSFRARIQENLTLAEQRDWQEQGSLPDLSQDFRDFEAVAIYPDWLTLKDLDARFTKEIGRLQAVWSSGAATCEEMNAQIAASSELTETKAWRKIQKIVTALSGKEIETLSQKDFKTCEEGLFLIGQARLELRTRDLLGEIETTQQALEKGGLGPFLPEYTDALEKAASLARASIPLSETEYALFSDRAKTVFDRFDAAEAAFVKANKRNRNLSAEQDTLGTQLQSLGLTSYTAYKDMQANMQDTTRGHLLERNVALEFNVAQMRELIRKYEAGELLNCTFGNRALTPYHFAPEDIAKVTAQMPEGNNAAVAPSRACLSDAAISVEELMSYHDSLPAREQSLKSEIVAAVPSESGTAQNISYWLAERYSAYLSEETGTSFCVAPALATVLSAGVENSTLKAETGELFSDQCGDGGPTGSKLVLYGIGEGQFNTGCVSVNRRQADLSFRLAAGEVCAP